MLASRISNFKPTLRNTIHVARSFSSNVLLLGDDQAFEKISQSPGKKIYYFTASWCPPCKAIAPIFDKLSIQYKDISFVKIDVDNLSATAQAYYIRSVPTFIFMNGENAIGQFAGASESMLTANINKLLELK